MEDTISGSNLTGLWTRVDKRTTFTVMLNDECYFIEKMNHYNIYRSQRYQENGDWYMGIRKNGWMKNGSKTHKGQNAIYFLPIPVMAAYSNLCADQRPSKQPKRCKKL